MNLKNYLNLGLYDLALSCDDYNSPWLFDWLITHNMAFLSPQSTMSHNLSQVIKIYICQIFGKEKFYSWHLDKKSNYTLFGSRTYMFWIKKWWRRGLELSEWNLEKEQPAHKYRTRLERGYKMTSTPSAKLAFPPSNQPSRLSSTFIGDFEFPPWKGSEGDCIGGDLHQVWRLWDLDFVSHLHSLSRYPNPRTSFDLRG